MRRALIAAVLLASACSSGAPATSREGSPSEAGATPPLAAGAFWGPSTIDADPTDAAADAIANMLRLRPDEFLAAVFMVEHQEARNRVAIQVFSAAGFTADELGIRWLRSQTADCDPVGPRDELIADLPARITHQLIHDRCQAQYLVLLDAETVAVLTDDRGFDIGDPANPPPVPERPVEEIHQLVTWLVQELETVDLVSGAQPSSQG